MNPVPFSWMIIGGVSLFALGVIGTEIQSVRLSWAQAELANERASRATEKAIAEETARKAEARIAAKERDHAVQQQALVEAQTVEKDKLEAALTAARADGDSLRADIQRFASSRPVGTTVDAAACKRLADRARTLGNLFSKADSLAEELARDAEQRNGEVRTLKRQILADRSACSSPAP